MACQPLQKRRAAGFAFIDSRITRGVRHVRPWALRFASVRLTPAVPRRRVRIQEIFLLIQVSHVCGFSNDTDFTFSFSATRGAMAGTARWDTETFAFAQCPRKLSSRTKAVTRSDFASVLLALGTRCSTPLIRNKSRTRYSLSGSMIAGSLD